MNNGCMYEHPVPTTKHQRISQWIVEGIETGRLAPGDKLPSESELCRLFGVSRNSVRQAIGTLTNEGWLETRKGIGTFCRLRSRRLTMDVGLVCYYTASYIFPRISRGCDQVAHRRGFHLILNQSEYDLDKEREILLKLKKRGVDGLVIEPINPGAGRTNLDLLLQLEESGIPVILIDNFFPDQRFSRVVMDDRAGGRLVAAYLWDRGHRRIGIVSDHPAGYYPKRMRVEGARALLEERGAAIPERWLLESAGPVLSGETLRVLSAFFERERDLPSAFICTSDEEAIELYKAAEKHGVRIPQDLSVIGFDNSPVAVLPGISLTSVDHAGQYMGELATRILLERIMNPSVNCDTTSVIQPSLVERASVATIQRSAE